MSDKIEIKVFELLHNACSHTGLSIPIKAEQRLAALGIDSMKMVEITFELEKYFDLEIQESLLSQLVTVKDLVEAAKTANSGERRVV